MDVPYQYLTFFLENEEELEQIRREYGAGRMKSSQVKQRLVEVLNIIVRQHQVRCVFIHRVHHSPLRRKLAPRLRKRWWTISCQSRNLLHLNTRPRVELPLSLAIFSLSLVLR